MRGEAGAGGGDLGHRDDDVDLGRRQLLRIERQRAGDVAENTEIGSDAQVIDFPADHRVVVVDYVGAAGHPRGVALAEFHLLREERCRAGDGADSDQGKLLG